MTQLHRLAPGLVDGRKEAANELDVIRDDHVAEFEGLRRAHTWDPLAERRGTHGRSYPGAKRFQRPSF